MPLTALDLDCGTGRSLLARAALAVLSSLTVLLLRLRGITAFRTERPSEYSLSRSAVYHYLLLKWSIM